MALRTYTFQLEPAYISVVLGPLRAAMSTAITNGRAPIDARTGWGHKQRNDAIREAEALHEVIKQITNSHMSRDDNEDGSAA